MSQPKPEARVRTPDELIAVLDGAIEALKASASSVSRDYYIGRAVARIEAAIQEIQDLKASS